MHNDYHLMIIIESNGLNLRAFINYSLNRYFFDYSVQGVWMGKWDRGSFKKWIGRGKKLGSITHFQSNTPFLLP